MDLRAGSPAVEGRTRSRSLRGSILARPPSSCAHDDDRLRFPAVSQAQSGKAGKKESTGRRRNRHCPPYVKPFSRSWLDRLHSHVPIAENGYPSSGGMSKSAKVVLGRGLISAVQESLSGRSGGNRPAACG